jgi:hypothetical protein
LYQGCSVSALLNDALSSGLYPHLHHVIVSRRSVVAASDVLGQADAVRYGGWRRHLQSPTWLRQIYRVGVFIVGLLLMVLGLSLVLLPGPFTIPPVLLGLWIWSTEFAFAGHLFQHVKLRSKNAWERAESHPVVSTLIVFGGLAATGAGAWALVP